MVSFTQEARRALGDRLSHTTGGPAAAAVVHPDGDEAELLPGSLHAGGAQETLIVFDLLRLNGDDLRLRPIEARREALMRLVAGVKGILFSQALAAEGAIVFAKACELGLEGIVSKRQGSFYRAALPRNTKHSAR